MRDKSIIFASRYFDVLAALFITTLIVSNIASIKIVGSGFWVFDAGTILFPLAYIVGDIITEVYGFKRIRRLLFIGIGMLLLTTLVFWIVGMLPASTDWQLQSSYDDILGVVWRIVLASITAIIVGELLNAYVLAKLKIKFEGKRLWSRIIGSSLVGNAADTVIFSVIAFAGTMSGSVLMQLIATVYAVKMLTEVAVSPLTVRVIQYIKKHENIDVFEEPRWSSVNKEI